MESKVKKTSKNGRILAEAWDEGRKSQGIENKIRTSKNRYT